MDVAFGPMSREIIAGLNKWADCNQRNIMLIASRSQIDCELNGGGYVMSTEEFGNIGFSDRITLCRDHCGPFLSKLDIGATMEQAVDACKNGINADIAAGFKLIHVDASMCGPQEREIATELVTYTTNLADVAIEYGSEDNVGLASSLVKFESDLQFITSIVTPRYVVGQTGSLVKQTAQIGTFDVGHVNKLVRLANAYGTKLKEHNADYLDPADITKRRNAGVHAVNIAPQLGVTQTIVISLAAEACGLHDEWADFRDCIIQGMNWVKWEPKTLQDQIACAGHYHFNSEQYAVLMDKLRSRCNIDESIETAIFKIADQYSS